MSTLAFGTLCFSSLLTVLDPVAVAPIWSSLTRGVDPATRRRTLWRACAAALVALLSFAVAGTTLLRTFGVTLDAFRIAGGMLFVGLALPMLKGLHPQVQVTPGSDPGVVPLGIPLLAGPGALTTVMVLMGQATDAMATLAVLVAVVAALLVTAAVLAVAPLVLDRVGPSGVDVVTRLMGLLILVLGVQLVLDGFGPVVAGWVRG